MIVVPEYYKKFKCIADKCAHNCCIGWEIDIDEGTLDYYKQLDGAIGEKLSVNIEYSEDVAHFVPDKEERCPFLTKSGMCEIIAALGEDALCDICTDHPRFRNFYENFTEMGLGLCCEEAARVILNEEKTFSLLAEGEISLLPEEEEMFYARNEIFAILTNRNNAISERLLELADKYGYKPALGRQEEICDIYLSLERLDEKWTKTLKELSAYEFSGEIFSDNSLQVPFEQLSCYFIFRHFPGELLDGNFLGRARLALSGCFLIGALCEKYKKDNGEISVEIMAEFARMFSCEIEYSEENINALLAVL